MAAKVMIFIDGAWLYHSRQVLFDCLNEQDGFEIDYKRIPDIIANEISQYLGMEVDLVRTCYFGTIPSHRPGYNPAKQTAFYEFLAMQCAYDTEILDIDFRRDPHAGDKSVHVALASAMMYYAAVPGVFDVAAIIAGDSDYVSLLRRVRAVGKRTQLVAINNINGRYATSATLMTTPGIQDLPPIFLDEHAKEMRLVREEQRRTCKTCGKEEVTTWAGSDFFCADCRQSRKQLRTCDGCGREEETAWDKPIFYCSECRKDRRFDSRQQNEAREAPVPPPAAAKIQPPPPPPPPAPEVAEKPVRARRTTQTAR